MKILDDPDRFRSKLDDLPFLMWVGECMSYGPPRLQQRLIALIDPDTVRRLATGRFSWAAAVILGRLPDEVTVCLADWIVEEWRRLPQHVAHNALLDLSRVLPDRAERLAIEHLESLGFAVARHPLATVLVRALERGTSADGLAAARRLIDQTLDSSFCRLRRDLLGLCIRRKVPGGSRVFLDALAQQPHGRTRELILETLTSRHPGQLRLDFALRDLGHGRGKAVWPRLALLMLPRTHLDDVVRIIGGPIRHLRAGILGWAAEVFDTTTRPRVLSLLDELDPGAPGLARIAGAPGRAAGSR